MENLERTRIRMYRVGFGDCFLLSLPSETGAKHILIDCGVHPRGDIRTLERVVANIVRTTERKLAVVIATHAHRDHVYAFGRFAGFRRFEIGEVWLPWTENPADEQAARLKGKRTALVQRLGMHFRAMGAAEQQQYRAAADAVANMSGNEPALRQLVHGFGTGATVRFLEGGIVLKSPAGIEGLTVRLLGPPRRPEFLARMDPPAGQRYLYAGDKEAASGPPFAPRWRYQPGGRSPKLGKSDLAALHSYADSPADKLAFALDSVLNNTSLVTLFSYRGRNLLFAGDAQYGSWDWWMRQGNGGELLSQVDFYKVSHHGSANGTPVKALEKLGNFDAMVSTQCAPFPTLPAPRLLDAIDKRARNPVLRSDSLLVANAPMGPEREALPRGFERGDLWFDYFV